ncbi:MAG: hypothetical protein LC650_02335 [Actinobacteria bacterium]|nr:hypothetical protein [Actinomycetota bacterium]
MNTTTKTHTETPVPKGAVPYDEYGSNWSQDGGIMSMRWENRELIGQLWQNLAYMTPKTFNGRPYLVATSHAKPPINYEGAKAIINIIQSVVNTVGSLSKIHQEQALVLLKHIKQSARRLVVVKGHEYECHKRVDKQLVLQIVENICLLQLMRAVNGHESTHSRTNLLERDEKGTYKQEVRGGGMKMPWDRER